MPRRKKSVSPIRHAFLYKVPMPDGSVQLKRSMAKVIRAEQDVHLILTAEDVLRSQERGGGGNTTTCSMAICTYNHKRSFPHKVVGWSDWTYTRAYIASKLNEHGLPVECYCYEHHDSVARLNDAPNGHEELLKLIRDRGPLLITLTPYRQRSEIGRPGVGRGSPGTRSPESRLKGAKLRYAVFQAGATPDGTSPGAA